MSAQLPVIDMIWPIILLTIVQFYLAFLVGYLILLTIAGWRASRFAPSLTENAVSRFLILIPAHNEERYLPDLLSSLARLDYPADQFEIHVVADNCTDQTAAVAKQAGAQVHIRNDHEHLGKGYALNWLLEQIQQESKSYDAVLFVDADSVISPNFLKVMSAHLAAGERVIQAFYGVRDAGQSWAASLRFAAITVLHFLRPQGRMALRVSVGLKGNGMIFAADLLEKDMWSASLTEDIELHMRLVLNRERVFFAPEAKVWGEMPNNLSSSTSQHMRWEQGKKQAARTFIPRLLIAAWREIRAGRLHRAFLLCDAIMEFLLPPFSILALFSLIGLAASLVLLLTISAASIGKATGVTGSLAALNVLVATLILLGQGMYLFAGLQAVSAPKQVYLNLLNAPRLMIWKTWQMLLVLMGQRQSLWIRTKRNRS